MAHSSAARAAVENLTRVLSIEWARFGIRLTARRAGPDGHRDDADQVPEGGGGGRGAARCRSGGSAPRRSSPGWWPTWRRPAGDYLSGAVLTLDGARDNWFGAWPPRGLTGEGGKPLAEERRPKE